MPKPPRYEARDDMTLYDRRKEIILPIKEFSVKRSGRIEIVSIETQSGKKLKIARYTIDETKFSFGPASTLRAARMRHRPIELETPPPAPQTQTALATREVSFKLKREGAVHMLNILRGVEEILMRELITDTLGQPS